MLGYATVGARDLEAAKQFYDQILGLAGMKTMFEHPSGGRLYNSPDGRMFGVLAPADGREASVGNGSMVGFLVGSRAAVRQIHGKALELGGSCEGAPGPRGPEEMQAYFAYFRDLDGNKLCAYCFGPE